MSLKSDKPTEVPDWHDLQGKGDSSLIDDFIRFRKEEREREEEEVRRWADCGLEERKS